MDIPDIRQTLHNAVKDGKLFEVLGDTGAAMRSRKDDTVINALVQLHEEEFIDVVQEFTKLNKIEETQGPQFFLLRDIFERILPRISAPMSAVLTCVGHLFRQAGHDGAAGTVLSAFGAYLEVGKGRSDEAFTAIMNQPTDFVEMMLQTLVSGAKAEPKQYFSRALSLLEHTDVRLRQSGLFALGRFDYTNPELEEEASTAVNTLLQLARDSDTDEELRCIPDSAVRLHDAIPSVCSETLAATMVNECCSKGGLTAVYASCSAIAYGRAGVSTGLARCLLGLPVSASEDSPGVHHAMDHIIETLLERNQESEAIKSYFAALLKAHPDILDHSDALYGGVSHTLMTKREVLARFAIDWLLSGDRRLCEIVEKVVSSGHGSPLLLPVPTTTAAGLSDNECVFLARKAIGYFFTHPITAISVIISLVEGPRSKTCVEHICTLVEEVLLLNYSGSARDYLNEQAGQHASENVRLFCQTAVQQLDAYLAGLQRVKDLPELQPSNEDRFIAMERQNRQMTDQLREARKKSVLLSLFSTTQLLYGKTSIHYIYGGQDQPGQRLEQPLGHISHQFEMPRQMHLCPVHLNRTVFMFRRERLKP